jgi:hypothetical protein
VPQEIGLREDCRSSGLFCQDCESDAVRRIAIYPIDRLVAPTLVPTDVRGRESRCHPLKFETMCWGADIEAVHRVNQDRLRALAQQMWNRGANSMCDYSLMHVKSRPASVGDKLRTTNFGTGTRGFAAPSDPGTAVCVLPGTELAFNSEIAVYGAAAPTRHKTAIFRQINREQPHMHHDALELPDGQTLLLTFLCEGQEVTVLQLPAKPTNNEEARAQERVAFAG